MNKFNAPSYQRKVTNYKNRRQAVRKTLTHYIAEVVKENGPITFEEPRKVSSSQFNVTSLSYGRCPLPYAANPETETYDDGVIMHLAVAKLSKGFIPSMASLDNEHDIDSLLVLATEVEKATHSPIPLDELAKEVEALAAIKVKESVEMTAWIDAAVKEVGEIRSPEPLSVPGIIADPVVAVKIASAKSVDGKEKVDQVCLCYMAENKLCGAFEKKSPLAGRGKHLTGLLQLAKAIDAVVNAPAKQ